MEIILHKSKEQLPANSSYLTQWLNKYDYKPTGLSQLIIQQTVKHVNHTVRRHSWIGRSEGVIMPGLSKPHA